MMKWQLWIALLLIAGCGARPIRTATHDEAECEMRIQAIVDRQGTTLEEDLRDLAAETERCTNLLNSRIP